ncbi:hypothetical protein Cme02nite_71310 [Catellatospora methionotrophica]|uniref:Uncharacterized protein n=1 Tax=Catellatospora methionotrophica TaxID=121620 RepID=A0A8J3PJH5_9ACTN|nr:hypothetical protein [Catellatospora methionotrophica]GIG18799.1 hypothetical protein Cme02nite_71310 [Catellatospora methionotrophica]
MSSPVDLANEMQTVLRALEQARVLVAGLDQADTARKLANKVAYSPLRTLLEHAEQAAARVVGHLGTQVPSPLDQPCLSRDGGPL